MSTAGPHAAFFYGTLMAPTVMWRVIHGTPEPEEFQKKQTTSSTAVLSGYERRKVKFCDYPAIAPCEDSSVRGLLVTGLNDMNMIHLDTFEGDQYTREKVQVKVFKNLAVDEKADETEEGEMVEAETYVWCTESKGLEAKEWDFAEFQKEKMHRWDGLFEDDGFDDVDRQVATEEQTATDPTGGRSAKGAIGKELETM